MGIIGALIGGTIFGGVGIATGYLLGFIALISGAIPGVLLGYSTRNESKLPRAVIGAGLGFASILFGYYMIYQMAEIAVELPLYKIVYHVRPCEVMSFSKFMSNTLEPLDALFFIIGVAESAALSVREYS